MNVVVGPNLTQRSHHISLSDGKDTVGLIMCDSNGNANPFAISRAPVPRTAMKTTSGNQKYSDFEPPWSPVAQEDWSGGRGMIDFDLDVSRYFDNWRANTLYGKIFLGGQETYATGYRNADNNLPGSLRWIAMLPSSQKYLAVKFAASASYDATSIYLWLKRRGTPPEDLNIAICEDSAGAPGAELQTATIDTDDITDTVSEFRKIAITAQALTSGTSYWVVISSADADSSNYWAVGVEDAAGTTKESDDGTTWSESIIDLYYRITGADSGYSSRFFTYKRQQYMIRNLTGSAPKLYVNGARGVADSNAGALGTLVDAAKSWVVNEWAGCVAMIIGGPGANEPKPWRNIVSNTDTTLTVDSPWLIAHTTNTEYIILNSNKWTEIAGHGLTANVTDILVVNQIVYFAQGDAVNIRRARWYNDAGTEAYQYADDGTNKATFLCTVRNTTTGEFDIWRANNLDANNFISVSKSAVKAWGTDLIFGTAKTLKDDYGNITGITEYGPNTKMLWILREGSVFAFVSGEPDEIPLKEMHAAAEYTNGTAFLAHNVYLYFNFGNGIERYYNSLLDDVGPNKYDGLPTERQGVVSCLAGYPGKFYASIDADTTGISCVIGNAQDAASGMGWNEIYRAPAVGQRITNIAFQPIPGSTIDRMWIAVGDDIVWIPFSSGSIEPVNDSAYRYIHESTLITGYMYVGLYDIFKFFHSLKIFAENMSEDDGQWIEADYQIDDDTDWMPLPESFYLSPMHENKLVSSYGINGKRIRFRLRLQTSDNTKTPVVKGIVVENVSRVPVKYSFSFAYRNYDKDVNLLGESEILTSAERQTLLDTWATELTPLILHSNYAQYDNRVVFIDPATVQPIKQSKEGYIEKMAVVEV